MPVELEAHLVQGGVEGEDLDARRRDPYLLAPQVGDGLHAPIGPGDKADALTRDALDLLEMLTKTGGRPPESERWLLALNRDDSPLGPQA